MTVVRGIDELEQIGGRIKVVKRDHRANCGAHISRETLEFAPHDAGSIVQEGFRKEMLRERRSLYTDELPCANSKDAGALLLSLTICPSSSLITRSAT